jgi:hypothetical protein
VIIVNWSGSLIAVTEHYNQNSAVLILKIIPDILEKPNSYIGASKQHTQLRSIQLI